MIEARGASLTFRDIPGLAHVPAALHSLLALLFLLYCFIGTNAFSTTSLTQRLEGNPLDRIVVLAMAMLAIVVLALYWRTVPGMALRSLGVLAIAGIAVLSMFWSDFPGLTLRRAILLACFTLITAALAAGVRDLRSAHTAFCWGITAIVILNLIVIFAMPSLGVDDLGAKGLYSQKNVAGMVGMAAVLATATWTARGHRDGMNVLFGVAMTAIGIAFLILTRSKTSIGLTFGALAILGILAFAARSGPTVALAVVMAGFLGLFAGLAFLIAHDLDMNAITLILFGDASFTGRDELWAFARKSMFERPWLGHGYGAFWDVGPGRDPLLRLEPGSWLGDVELGLINQAHNGYLQLGIELGIPVTILAVFTVLCLIVRGVLLCLLARMPCGTAAGFAYMTAMLVLFLLHNFTEASLFMRGIVLFNIVLPMMFLLARGRDLLPSPAARPSFSMGKLP